jgi:hypothetical protein
MTPKEQMPVKRVKGVYITARETLTGKRGPYWKYKSSEGALICFSAELADKITNEPDMAWELDLKESEPPYKVYQIMGVYGGVVQVRQEPKPAPQKTEAPSYTGAKYKDDKTAVFEEKDFRISKLSIFSSIVNLMAAKAKADPEFGKQDLSAMLLCATEFANIVTKEFIYGVPRSAMDEPAPVDQPAAAKPETTTTTSAPQYAEQKVYTPPPATQPAAAATPAAPPAQPQETSAMGQEAKNLFGVNKDLEARMAARLKALTEGAKR